MRVPDHRTGASAANVLGALGRAAQRMLPGRLTARIPKPSRQGTADGLDLGDLRRTTPISGDWGFDRGTPVDRYYIHDFLHANAASIHGRILEVDTDEYTRTFGGSRVTISDVLHLSERLPGVTMVGDLAGDNDIPSEVFDCVIVTQTLHLIYEPAAAVRTIHRILKPGGVALATFPGISKITGDPEGRWGYFWGFTAMSARLLFAGQFAGERVDVTAYGTVGSATAFLYGLAAEELDPELLERHDKNCQLLLGVRAVKGAAP